MSPADFLPYGKQQIDDDDVAAVVEALRAPYLTQGPRVAAFEDALAHYVGAAHISAVANGTAALHLAYAALGLAAGDEIITSPITFAATANAAHMVGARVRFADVEPDTGNLCPASVESLITHRTQGVVAVHLAGLPADLAALRRICDQHGLWLVEDASHALGASYRGAPIGCCRYSEAATFSFHPVKHLTTLEGGAIAVRDPELKRRIDRLREHGIERADFLQPAPGPWYYEVQSLGWNYRLSDVQCALGMSQLGKQEGWLARRQALARRYRARIGAHHGSTMTVQAERPGRTHAYHLLIALIDFAALGCTRGQVMRSLRDHGIGSQVHYIPVTHHPYYREIYGDPAERPGVDRFYERALSLPLYPALTGADVDRIVECLVSAARGVRQAA
jgi:UDP-4-amino-4,6-dideoxy-N-acetyl-beta-L-altrosamine transaminase